MTKAFVGRALQAEQAAHPGCEKHAAERCDRPQLLPLPLVAAVAASIAGNGCPLCSWHLQVAAEGCNRGNSRNGSGRK